MTLYKIAVRIDKEVDKFVSFLNSKDISGWAVRETVNGANEHVHAYLETLIKPNSLRVLIKRAIPELAGNGSYSIQDVKDYDKYVRYMAKGESTSLMPQIVWKLGPLWTVEYIEKLHEEYWTENRTLKKRRADTVTDYVIDRCKEEGVAWDDRTAIAEMYIKELVERSKAINIYSVKSNVNLIQVKLCPDDSAVRMLAEQVHI